MTGLERAKTYAAIFIGAGPDWQQYVPVDATVTARDVYLQGVRMRPCKDGAWSLETNTETWIIRPKEKKP